MSGMFSFMTQRMTRKIVGDGTIKEAGNMNLLFRATIFWEVLPIRIAGLLMIRMNI